MIRHALVLTAGLGTRLRPLTDVRAKPAIPVAGEPLIRRIIRWLVAAGVTDLVLNLHHRPETIAAVVGDGSDLGARVRYSWEQPRVLGSAGGPRLARPLVGVERFFVVNGDTLTDLDLQEVAQAHAASRARVTLALVPNREFARYGGVGVDDDRRVLAFVPRGPAAEGSFHFVGVQVVDADVFDSIAPGEAASSIGGLYDALMLHQPGAVRAFTCDAPFFDVGTVADYWRTSARFASVDPTPVAAAGRPPRIAASACVTRSIMWDDVEVGEGAMLDRCIVTDGVVVPPGAKHAASALVRGDGGDVIAYPISLEPQ
jgi:NDP-sugar pyrophosphorylase family protein